MGIIVGIIVFLIVLGLLSSVIERGARSRLLRPYIGLLMISGLVAGLGLALGVLSSDLEHIALSTAKIIAVLTCVALCLQLIIVIGKRWL
ncbi:hypothetical protein DFO61_3833 [Ectopseudomonas oleovorans]|uniref:Uncharacterized protein n=1 Tax=Ectopseudomonas oleovorans TaxID=301 RepID=A0A397M8S1_ECTOL|nr:hypothetical protein [Pseudomonas oleovorans]RIA21410.1 hypothetical protein DFO61_3833 [Pseudomonas oleovorans]